MERRSFLGTVTGLAATAVVGGLPALAGGSDLSAHNFNFFFPEKLERFFQCTSIFRERQMSGGEWQVIGYNANQVEFGRMERVGFASMSEEWSKALAQYWSRLKEQGGKLVQCNDITHDMSSYKADYIEQYSIIAEAC